MALNSLFCADVPLSNYSPSPGAGREFSTIAEQQTLVPNVPQFHSKRSNFNRTECTSTKCILNVHSMADSEF